MGAGINAVLNRALADAAAVPADDEGRLLLVGSLAAIAVAAIRVEPST
jgi:hypothetical protein